MGTFLELLVSLWLSVLSFLVSHIEDRYTTPSASQLIRQQVGVVVFDVGYQKGEYRKLKANK